MGNDIDVPADYLTVLEAIKRDVRTARRRARRVVNAEWSNLHYTRAFAEARPEIAFVQQAVGQMPWGHVTVLLDKLSDGEKCDWYAAQALDEPTEPAHASTVGLGLVKGVLRRR